MSNGSQAPPGIGGQGVAEDTREFRDASDGSGVMNLGGGTSGISGSGSASDVFRVGVRIPPFWPEEPEVWFAQVESQFELSNVTSDSTKFNFVASQLDQEYARTMKDLLIKPPRTGKYDKFKSELIKRISATQEKKTQQLMQHEELGDRKPTQFLRHLRDLAGPTIPDDFIRTVWASRLPPNVQTIVASQHRQNLDDVAELADRVHDVTRTSAHVAAATATTTPPAIPGTTLEARVEALTRQVETLLRSQGTYSRSRSHSRGRFNRRGSRSKSRSRQRSREQPEGHPHCWYHYQFGNNAKNCKAPCSFNSSLNDKGSI